MCDVCRVLFIDRDDVGDDDDSHSSNNNNVDDDLQLTNQLNCKENPLVKLRNRYISLFSCPYALNSTVQHRINQSSHLGTVLSQWIQF